MKLLFLMIVCMICMMTNAHAQVASDSLLIEAIQDRLAVIAERDGEKQKFHLVTELGEVYYHRWGGKKKVMISYSTCSGVEYQYYSAYYSAGYFTIRQPWEHGSFGEEDHRSDGTEFLHYILKLLE